MSQKIRLAGRRVLDRVAPPVKCTAGEYTPVTAARRFLAERGFFGGEHGLVQVRDQNKYYNFYWCEKGLFDVAYVEKFYFLFPSLRSIVDSVGEDELFEGLYLTVEDWDEVWEEMGKIPDS